MLPKKAFNLAMEYDLNPATTTSSVVLIHNECPVAFQFQAVTEKEVESVVKGLSSNKAPGHDKITTRVLKNDFQSIVRTLKSLFPTFCFVSCKASHSVAFRIYLHEVNSKFHVNCHFSMRSFMLHSF